ncbi:hypothetical protein QBC34DRAFT_363084 [Podospora aff. communis PSN243]|uniref:Carboxylic ester hydrolase n=1 Tax=Podospora aff. communis PSN243 TaxID=3040156 RepID=A0AAV9G475_9PEZI|nr:hypothetical protein QBC34DRAFT_363084 [Podospora aff. communis PSN243]
MSATVTSYRDQDRPQSPPAAGATPPSNDTESLPAAEIDAHIVTIPLHPRGGRDDQVPDSTPLQKPPGQDEHSPKPLKADGALGRLKRRARTAWHTMQPLWPLETLSIIVALGLLGAVIGVLVRFDDREIGEWTFPINLSTLVSILATLLRVCILYAVSEIISQLKWVWFTRRTRPLINLHNFDQASRGPLGSVLLWKMLLGQTPSWLGAGAAAAAFVVVVSFAIGSFAQQALSTRHCERIAVDLPSSIPVVNYFRGDTYRIAAGMWELTVGMKAAILQGLTNPESQDVGVKAACPTGNCTFPDFGTGVTHASIGMCSKCVDMSPHAQTTPGMIPSMNPNITLGTLWIARGYDAPYLRTGWGSSTEEPDPLSTTGGKLQRAVGHAYVLAASNSPCTRNSTGSVVSCPHNENLTGGDYGGTADFVAAKCTLYPCLRTYHGFVRNGVLHETLVSAVQVPHRTATTTSSLTGNHSAFLTPCVPNPNTGTWYTESNISAYPRTIPSQTFSTFKNSSGSDIAVPNTCIYKYSAIHAHALAAFFITLFSDAQCTYNGRQGLDQLLCSDHWWLAPLYHYRNASVESISDVMSDMTTAVTNLMRTTGYGPDEVSSGGAEWRGAGYGVKGQVVRMGTCTYFDWRWLAFPGGLLVIGMGLLVWAVSGSWGGRVPLWKDSVLPLVFWGLGGRVDEEGSGGGDGTVAGMEKAAEAVMVRFSCALGFVVEEDDTGGVAGASGPAEEGEEGYLMDSLW